MNNGSLNNIHTLIEDYIKYIYLFIITLIITVRINYYKKPGVKEKLLLFWGKKGCFHIHHWITFIILSGVFILGKYASSTIFYIIITIFIAISCEDLLFRDIFNFRC